MKIAVLGASAGVGLHCVETALARGHDVLSLSRSTASLPTHPRLTAVRGSATVDADLRQVLHGAEAILVALGTGKSTKATTLYTDFARAVLQARDVVGHKPLIVLTGFGAGDSARYHGPLIALMFRLFLKEVYADKTAMEDQLMASDLNWMLVRPGVLTNGAATHTHVQADYHSGMKVGSVSRRAVAQFMVEQAERPRYLKQKPALG